LHLRNVLSVIKHILTMADGEFHEQKGLTSRWRRSLQRVGEEGLAPNCAKRREVLTQTRAQSNLARRNSDLLAVEAVVSEPVSGLCSLFHGKIQGNSPISGLR
jgi:hypothetical protein